MDDAEALALADRDDLPALMTAAARLRDAWHGDLISYSRKVFIPLTELCRDACGYCTFAQPPRNRPASYMTPGQVMAVAEAGVRAGCREALFTLGDKPELRYRQARAALAELGHATTLDYLAAVARRVQDETGLFVHINAGVMSADDILRLRAVSVSQGLMLESTAERLGLPGGPHHGAPDKAPAARLATIAAAGEATVPFTSGLLIGIGETRRERIEALLALRELHARFGHVQEVIIQNFRAKPGTRMAAAPEPTHRDHLWTIAVARLVLGGEMNIQAPPNLRGGALKDMIDAGINDWGGVSPVTPDHVNPEKPWPELAELRRGTEAAGKHLVQRLPIYPSYACDAARWVAAPLRTRVRHAIEGDGFARIDSWTAGTGSALPLPAYHADGTAGALAPILRCAAAGDELGETDLVRLLTARGAGFEAVCEAADAVRQAVSGDVVRYVVTRNINYTNVCTYRCQFCAFSKGKLSPSLRGRPYDLALEEIVRRAAEAWDRGATEVCLQGGIHPDYTGETYIEICRAIRAAVPGLHVHAFSPLEIWQGAATLGVPLARFLERLRDAGLATLPGTAAEILDDDVRQIICPDKITTEQWLEVMETAHQVGLRSTATIMFGHVEQPIHVARHLLRLRRLQARTGGFTELVPLPFVPMETPIHLQGNCRPGPTWREAVLMHAVARLALRGQIDNIQVSWVKMGPDGAAKCLQAGANDLGGTLMNESITRAAGATHGQEMPPPAMEAVIRGVGRIPQQRTTLYAPVPSERRDAAFAALPLAPTIDTPVRRRRAAAM